ncbi:restriction endonuclease [Bradyrhizobium sp. SZCCHNPS1003]|uniref:restriction endonuclease n=1 Tax=Bradyrhizobium sp. SZCCHNPS1003 TaxID=3057330 RepID=UPI0028EC62B7|nr:restriction endonuclease [Bradyrhizobium sp. SZCCHNPS1003]
MTSTIRRLNHATFGRYDHVDLDTDEISFAKAVKIHQCPICGSPFRTFTHALSNVRTLHLVLCPACGWWHLHREEEFLNSRTNQNVHATWWELYHAVYSEVPPGSPDVPIEQLRVHLARFWEQRKHITAQQAEDLVASVLREHYAGDILRLTANANAPDGGIDLFISNRDGQVQRAVQVKRRITHDVEAVTEVRNFVGAMLLSGVDHGIFVTTAARYTSDALAVAKNTNLSKHRLSLELIDGERLLELLEFANRSLAIQLPPDVQMGQLWSGDDGTMVEYQKLLFGDLPRLFPLATPR